MEKKINDNIKEFLRAFFEKYKDKSTNALVKGSHEEAPWKDTCVAGKKCHYTRKNGDFF